MFCGRMQELLIRPGGARQQRYESQTLCRISHKALPPPSLPSSISASMRSLARCELTPRSQLTRSPLMRWNGRRRRTSRRLLTSTTSTRWRCPLRRQLQRRALPPRLPLQSARSRSGGKSRSGSSRRGSLLSGRCPQSACMVAACSAHPPLLAPRPRPRLASRQGARLRTRRLRARAFRSPLRTSRSGRRGISGPMAAMVLVQVRVLAWALRVVVRRRRRVTTRWRP